MVVTVAVTSLLCRSAAATVSAPGLKACPLRRANQPFLQSPGASTGDSDQ